MEGIAVVLHVATLTHPHTHKLGPAVVASFGGLRLLCFMVVERATGYAVTCSHYCFVQAACVLHHESMLPLQTVVGAADRTEFSFVRSLVQNSLMCSRRKSATKHGEGALDMSGVGLPVRAGFEVEWLFTRSLVKHRHARDPTRWCSVPSVKVHQVDRIENRPG